LRGQPLETGSEGGRGTGKKNKGKASHESFLRGMAAKQGCMKREFGENGKNGGGTGGGKISPKPEYNK